MRSFGTVISDVDRWQYYSFLHSKPVRTPTAWARGHHRQYFHTLLKLTMASVLILPSSMTSLAFFSSVSSSTIFQALLTASKAFCALSVLSGFLSGCTRIERRRYAVFIDDKGSSGSTWPRCREGTRVRGLDGRQVRWRREGEGRGGEGEKRETIATKQRCKNGAKTAFFLSESLHEKIHFLRLYFLSRYSFFLQTSAILRIAK